LDPAWGRLIIACMLRCCVPKPMLCLLPALLLLLGAAACQPAVKQRQQLASGNPLDQALAAVALAEAGDAAAVQRLVSLLEDRDEAVRMFAILALERLCGRTYGYKYYETEAARMEAVRRWQDALRRGEVVVRRTPASGREKGFARRAPGAFEETSPPALGPDDAAESAAAQRPEGHERLP
jgi:hypothetical protein